MERKLWTFDRNTIVFCVLWESVIIPLIWKVKSPKRAASAQYWTLKWKLCVGKRNKSAQANFWWSKCSSGDRNPSLRRIWGEIDLALERTTNHHWSHVNPSFYCRSSNSSLALQNEPEITKIDRITAEKSPMTFCSIWFVLLLWEFRESRLLRSTNDQPRMPGHRSKKISSKGILEALKNKFWAL